MATYPGDTNYSGPVSSACTGDPSEQVTVGASTPTITTTASPGGPLGMAISDSATVSGVAGAANPTGTVIFELFPAADTTCSGPALFTVTAALNGATPPVATSPLVIPTAGDFHWVATYPGDTNYNGPVGSPCTGTGSEPVTITAGTATVTTTASAGGPLTVALSETAVPRGPPAEAVVVTVGLAEEMVTGSEPVPVQGERTGPL